MDLNKALSEGTNSAGGYSVPEIWAKKLYDLMQEKSKLIPLCEVVNMTSDTWYAPTVTDGSTAYWVAELGTITASDLTFGQVTLTAKKVAAKIQLSTELDEDSMVDIMKLVSNQMATDLALAVDSEILNGTGGQFTSYWRTIAGNTVTAGASGDDISVAKFSNAQYEGQVDYFNYDWTIMHPRCLRDVRNLTDANARPIFNQETFGSPLLKTGAIGTILGMKVMEHTSIPITITKSSGHTLTDVIVVQSKKCGIFGKRRGLTAHKFYDIDDDSWYLQVNMRVAFAVAYPNAICIIKDIK